MIIENVRNQSIRTLIINSHNNHLNNFWFVVNMKNENYFRQVHCSNEINSQLEKQRYKNIKKIG